MRTICGHFNFSIRENWIFCSDCFCGIAVDSKTGKRLLRRKHGNELGLTPQQLETWKGLVASYKELVEHAGTTDADVLADYANGGKE